MVGNERLEDKCEVCIENIRKENVRITLWGNTAKTFDSQALQQLTSPIFAAFTSLKVKQFQGKIVLNSSVSTLIFINPDIQELAAYKTIFNDSTHAIKMMPSSAAQLMTPQHLEAAKKLSVQELNVLDPETHKLLRVLIRVMVGGIKHVHLALNNLELLSTVMNFCAQNTIIKFLSLGSK
ncbi:uncharacterized protein LOC117612419 [Prunus dulcis]|nr:uncharacterized protein LOC117612419 [Prunus dulcis]